MIRSDLERSEVWLMVKQAINQQLSGLQSKLLGEDEPRELYRVQGAIQFLVSLRDDLPRSLPESVDPKGKPEPDPVRAVISKENQNGR